MIEDAKRSIAFLCPVCRQPVILERTVFQLAGHPGSRLPWSLREIRPYRLPDGGPGPPDGALPVL